MTAAPAPAGHERDLGGPVALEAVEVVTVRMPLRAPFRTSFGTQRTRDVVLVRVRADGGEGWGECTAPDAPVYSHEYAAGAVGVLRDHLAPRLLRPDAVAPTAVADLLAPVKGHPMAKAALELAVLDAALRIEGRSLAAAVGATRTRVPCGVSVGIPAGGVPALLDDVAAYLEQGYVRVKLKIEPGFDLEPVRAVRDRWPDLHLQVDANAAYRPDDAAHLRALDAFGLTLLEQPYPPDHLLDHARLAGQLDTPLCLDETLTSLQATADAIELGACEVVNVKLGRVGGMCAALAIHDEARARGVPLWCGGMLETGVGRAANLAFAALPGITLPGDTSASARYWDADVTAPFVLDDGHLAVPDVAGIGASPDPDRLAAWQRDRHVIERSEQDGAPT